MASQTAPEQNIFNWTMVAVSVAGDLVTSDSGVVSSDTQAHDQTIQIRGQLVPTQRPNRVKKISVPR